MILVLEELLLIGNFAEINERQYRLYLVKISFLGQNHLQTCVKTSEALPFYQSDTTKSLFGWPLIKHYNHHFDKTSQTVTFSA